MRKIFPVSLLVLLSFISLQGQTLKELEASRIKLPNGWSLTPAGDKLQLGDLPLNIAVSNDGNFIAVTNNGQSDQSIMIIDTKTGKRTDSLKVWVAWLGLAFSKDAKTLYASAGNDNKIFCYSHNQGKLTLTDSIKLGEQWPEKISPAGLCVDDGRKRLYVVTKENNSLYVINLENKKIVKQVNLPGEAYTCILNNNKLYISVWGDEKVMVYDTRKDTISASINVGSNPNDLALSHNGKYLFVSNANDNSVSVISAGDNKVLETLDAAIYPNSPEGSTTNSVAISADDKTLYIANADNNCLAVFDISKPGHSLSKGFIPTGWYPTCVRVVHNKIWVSNGKGFSSLANPNGPKPQIKKQQTNDKQEDKKKPKVQYIGGLFIGTMSIIPEPDSKSLADYTTAVYHNAPNKGIKNDSSLFTPGSSNIKYVFYVLKENRSYDQVLGDMPNGNGDSSLCLFPEKITPNEHALANEFVLLDNFYVDAEVSADGHNWSMAAYANDYVEKTWPTVYGNRGGDFDYGGNRKIALPKDGFIWDDCLKHNVTFRNYGEFCDDNGSTPLKDLTDHTCHQYPGWNLSVHDVDREKVWQKDFDSLVAANAVPQFNIVYLPDDHTSGLAKGAFTPYASMADNDLALGRFIEHLSQSSIWKHCAVFVVEDDAQSGADHVDAHRSTAFVAGPFVKRHYTDHTMYSTSAMLHTMECILGLPPMSQYDAAAMPMWNSFMHIPNPLPYIAKNSSIDIDEKNIVYNDLMRKSNKFNLRKEDQVPEEVFNEVLWKAIKGTIPMPSPRHSGFVLAISSGEKDDD